MATRGRPKRRVGTGAGKRAPARVAPNQKRREGKTTRPVRGRAASRQVPEQAPAPARAPLKPPPHALHSAIIGRPTTTPAYIRAAQSLLDSLGGEGVLIDTISDLSEPKAIALVERMRTPAFSDEPFAQKLAMCDVRMDVLLRMFAEGRRGRALARIMPDTDEVLAGVAERAKDKVVRCGACRNGGWALDPETDEQTDVPCWTCEGTGWVLREADLANVKLFLDTVGLSPEQGPVVAIDARRTSTNTFNQQNNVLYVGGNPTGAPDIASIIRRADQQVLALPEVGSVPDPMLPNDARSVNDAIEAEVVGE